MSKVLVILAEGAEELECVAVVDMLRRAGAEVQVAGLTGLDGVKCSRNVVIVPDVKLNDVENNVYDMVYIPGGMGGAKACRDSDVVRKILQKHEEEKKYCALICAGPLSLISHNIGKGKAVTSHPCIKQELVDAGYDYKEESIVVDEHLCTSRGPGTALLFGLKLVELLFGQEKRVAVQKPLMIPC